MKREHKDPSFLKINPNGKAPALVHKRKDGQQITVWESAACLQYLVDQFDAEHKVSFPHGTAEYYTMLSWVSCSSLFLLQPTCFAECPANTAQLSWQISALGPFLGQACHFLRYATEDVPYGIKRYVAEGRRLYTVMETHLSTPDTSFLVGSKFSIADIACYVWVSTAAFCGIDINDFPAVKAWRQRVGARPAVQKAMSSPVPFFATDENFQDEEIVGMWREKIRPVAVTAFAEETEEWSKNADIRG